MCAFPKAKSNISNINKQTNKKKKLSTYSSSNMGGVSLFGKGKKSNK